MGSFQGTRWLEVVFSMSLLVVWGGGMRSLDSKER